MDKIEKNNNMDFKNIIDKHQDIYNKCHSCEYTDLQKISDILPQHNFSIYSHNVRSLAGHFNDLKDNIDIMSPHTFSVIALQ